jgi:hypothetical protein
MACNFKVLTHRNDDQLHLKLLGDFDGSSAHELLNQLKKSCPKFTTIFIHTDCLKRLIPFGLGIFRTNISELDKRDTRIIFTGDNAPQFSPEIQR